MGLVDGRKKGREGCGLSEICTRKYICTYNTDIPSMAQPNFTSPAMTPSYQTPPLPKYIEEGMRVYDSAEAFQWLRQ